MHHTPSVSTSIDSGLKLPRTPRQSFAHSSAMAFHSIQLPVRGPPNRCFTLSTTCSLRRRPQLNDVVNEHELNDLVVGGLAVPRHRWRRDLRQRGVHRSVEYIIDGLSLDGLDLQRLYEAPDSRRQDVEVTMRPAGRLIPRLEREWPVTVSVGDAKLWSYKCDVAVCAIVCIGFSIAVVAGVVAIGDLCGIYKIVSDSMIPTLFRRDALLVEKVSIRAAPARKGEVVLVRPPPQVQRIARDEGRTLRFRDALVKRVVAVGGDLVEVDMSGVRVNGKLVSGKVADFMEPFLKKGTIQLQQGYIFVLGDNKDASLDSRFWGSIPSKDVIGRPIARIFPPERIGIWGQDDRR